MRKSKRFIVHPDLLAASPVLGLSELLCAVAQLLSYVSWLRLLARADLFDTLYYSAMGAIVYGECRDLGYTVDGNAWHALASHAYDEVAPGAYTPALFSADGKLRGPHRLVLTAIGRLSDVVGHEAFCSSIERWAAREHPRVGRDLITKSTR